MLQEDLWTQEELIAYLKISRASVYKLRAAGLPFIKLGRRVLFRKNDILAFIESQKIVLTPKKPSKRP